MNNRIAPLPKVKEFSVPIPAGAGVVSSSSEGERSWN